MHQRMKEYPDCFGFKQSDLPTSYLYDFILWLSVVVIYHDEIKGKMVFRSFKIFGICCVFFIGLTAVHMIHFKNGIRTFFVYRMIDALILFKFLGIPNRFLYSLFLKNGRYKLGYYWYW